MSDRLDFDSVQNKVSTLVILPMPLNKEYGYSGISSDKNFYKFLDDLLPSLKHKKISPLAALIHYPFSINFENKLITIENQNQFIMHSDIIVTKDFVNRLSAAIT